MFLRYALALIFLCHAGQVFASDWLLNSYVVVASCTITESPETTCTGGIDEDCDGLIDGADSDCTGLIGYSVTGGAGIIGGTTSNGISGKWVPTRPGPINYVNFDLGNCSTASTMNVAVYCETVAGCTGGYAQGDLIADGTNRTGVTTGVRSIQLDSTVTLVDGETYRLVVGLASGDSSWIIKGVNDDDGGAVDAWADTTYTVDNVMPAAFNEDVTDPDVSCIWGSYAAEGS
jgi:hypothetical protein